MTDLTPAERVARGAKWLDENYSGLQPWYEMIELERLDMNNRGTHGCILTRLYAPDSMSWHEAYTNACLGYGGTAAYGFSLGSHEYNYDEIEPAWRDEILKRRGALLPDRDFEMEIPELFTLFVSGSLVGHLTADSLARYLAVTGATDVRVTKTAMVG